MPFQFSKLSIPDIILIEPKVFEDPRGYFLESYKRSAFMEHGIDTQFVQDNLSHSARGTMRGLHYQKIPKAQGKLVMVLSGEVFDVAVDIREYSPTYGQWIGVVLSDKKFQMLYIPEGFAHGFCVLSDCADFMYKVTDDYAPEHERGIVWNDPTINIEWPISDPQLSARDAQLPTLENADINFSFKQ